LLLGYALSSSLLWPIGRIDNALNRMASGSFDARIAVPNRDELGKLAGHVNETSGKLGELYNKVEAQKAVLADWNIALEAKVAEQVVEIERTNRLRRFLPAQVADLITSADRESDALATRRSEVTVLFADLRGFTTFANTSAPDQVVGALNAFHEACGPLVQAEGGTLERFLGDGLMVLFGAPVPVEDAAERAVRLALAMRDAVRAALLPYQSEDTPLGFGIGIGTGAATLGQIGFEGRRDYSAIGPAPNLAARLCDMAADGQILLSHATVWQIERTAKLAGNVALKGIGENIAVFEV
jgi:class 3 adenylate cyclase/HAMP domain-containing protein